MGMKLFEMIHRIEHGLEGWYSGPGIYYREAESMSVAIWNRIWHRSPVCNVNGFSEVRCTFEYFWK
jgi:hypothetical protein